MKIEQLQEIKRAFIAQQGSGRACAIAALILMEDTVRAAGDLETLKSDEYWCTEYAEYLSMKGWVDTYLKSSTPR